jgi:hypothetical protein
MLTLAPAAAAAIASPQLAVAYLLELGFSTPVRFNSTPNTIAWAGNDWLGAGSLGKVEAVRDAIGELSKLQFTLSGVPTEAIALALGESARGVSCRLYFAIMDADTHAVLDAPLLWPGELDQMPIRQEATTCSIAVTAVHAGRVLQRPKYLRYTDADQRRIAPGDSSGRFVVSQAQHQDIWPAASFFRQ